MFVFGTIALIAGVILAGILFGEKEYKEPHVDTLDNTVKSSVTQLLNNNPTFSITKDTPDTLVNEFGNILNKSPITNCKISDSKDSTVTFFDSSVVELENELYALSYQGQNCSVKLFGTWRYLMVQTSSSTNTAIDTTFTVTLKDDNSYLWSEIN